MSESGFVYSAPPVPSNEDRFLIEWFGGVIHCYHKYRQTKLLDYQNSYINFYFKQPADYQNQVTFNINGGAVLTTQTMIIEYARIGKFFFERGMIIRKESTV